MRQLIFGVIFRVNCLLNHSRVSFVYFDQSDTRRKSWYCKECEILRWRLVGKRAAIDQAGGAK